MKITLTKENLKFLPLKVDVSKNLEINKVWFSNTLYEIMKIENTEIIGEDRTKKTNHFYTYELTIPCVGFSAYSMNLMRGISPECIIHNSKEQEKYERSLIIYKIPERYWEGIEVFLECDTFAVEINVFDLYEGITVNENLKNIISLITDEFKDVEDLEPRINSLIKKLKSLNLPSFL